MCRGSLSEHEGGRAHARGRESKERSHLHSYDLIERPSPSFMYELIIESAPLLALPQAQYFGLDLDIQPTKPDFFLEEGETFEVGDLRFEILHCPGHCPGSVVLFST